MLQSKELSFYLVALIIFILSAYNFDARGSDELQIVDRGKLAAVKIEKTKRPPVPTTITIHRDSQDHIDYINIAQSGKITTSGTVFEINQVLAAVTADEHIADRVTVVLKQDFSFGFDPIDVTGVHFSGVASDYPNLKNITLQVSQNLNSQWHGQVWKVVGYDMGLIIDGKKFLYNHDDLTTSSDSNAKLQEIFSFPATSGMYRSIAVVSNAVECKGKIIETNIEDMIIHPFALCGMKMGALKN